MTMSVTLFRFFWILQDLISMAMPSMQLLKGYLIILVEPNRDSEAVSKHPTRKAGRGSKTKTGKRQ